MVKSMEIDSNKCIGCLACVLACSLAKTEAFSYSNAVMKIVRDEPIELCQIYSCSNCTDRKCIQVCPFDAIGMSEEYGIPLIDYDKCTSCGLCAKSCTYQIIRINKANGEVYKCDFCGGSPACALSCIPNAIKANDICIKEVK